LPEDSVVTVNGTTDVLDKLDDAYLTRFGMIQSQAKVCQGQIAVAMVAGG
jgi:hypothetical protein